MIRIRLTITIRNTVYIWRTTEWCNAALIELSPRFAAALNEFRLCKKSLTQQNSLRAGALWELRWWHQRWMLLGWQSSYPGPSLVPHLPGVTSLKNVSFVDHGYHQPISSSRLTQPAATCVLVHHRRIHCMSVSIHKYLWFWWNCLIQCNRFLAVSLRLQLCPNPPLSAQCAATLAINMTHKHISMQLSSAGKAFQNSVSSQLLCEKHITASCLSQHFKRVSKRERDSGKMQLPAGSQKTLGCYLRSGYKGWAGFSALVTLMGDWTEWANWRRIIQENVLDITLLFRIYSYYILYYIDMRDASAWPICSQELKMDAWLFFEMQDW